MPAVQFFLSPAGGSGLEDRTWNDCVRVRRVDIKCGLCSPKNLHWSILVIAAMDGRQELEKRAKSNISQTLRL